MGLGMGLGFGLGFGFGFGLGLGLGFARLCLGSRTKSCARSTRHAAGTSGGKRRETWGRARARVRVRETRSG